MAIIDIDIGFLLSHLREKWEDSTKYSENPNAFLEMRLVSNTYMCCCPMHYESKPSFGIFTDYPYGWNCFSCGEHGSVNKLVAHVTGGTETHGEYYLEKLLYTDKGLLPPKSTQLIKKALDKKMRLRKEPDSLDEKEALKFKGIYHPYMGMRGFTKKAIETYELGYDKDTNSIVFPVRDIFGNIRFLQRRSVDRKSFYNDAGVEKKDILYGLNHIAKFNEGKRVNDCITEIYLVESAIDAISCYVARKPAVALMGRLLFRPQVEYLSRAGIMKINLFLDNDAAGRDATAKIAEQLRGYRIRFVQPIDNLKDANDILLAGRFNELESKCAIELMVERHKKLREEKDRRVENFKPISVKEHMDQLLATGEITQKYYDKYFKNSRVYGGGNGNE